MLDDQVKMKTSGIASIQGRFIFYNNSYYGANAIAPDKKPLFSGQTATFANYTSYSRGINGIIIDIQNSPAILSREDFEFQTGTKGNLPWFIAPAVSSVTLRPKAGVNGSDRYVIVWPDKAIKKLWLKIIVKSNSHTGLTSPDVFILEIQSQIADSEILKI